MGSHDERTDQGIQGGPSRAGAVAICRYSVVEAGAAGRGDGGDEETRTPDPLLAKEMLCQLSYVPLRREEVVGVSGLEPETSALSGQCSNQLS